MSDGLRERLADTIAEHPSWGSDPITHEPGIPSPHELADTLLEQFDVRDPAPQREAIEEAFQIADGCVAVTQERPSETWRAAFVAHFMERAGGVYDHPVGVTSDSLWRDREKLMLAADICGQSYAGGLDLAHDLREMAARVYDHPQPAPRDECQCGHGASYHRPYCHGNSPGGTSPCSCRVFDWARPVGVLPPDAKETQP